MAEEVKSDTSEALQRPLWQQVLIDALIGIGSALLLLLILFFSGGGSNFIYIDF